MSVILTVVGNVGRQAEIQVLQDGTRVINFNICHSESYEDKNGTKVNKDIWFSCSKFIKGDSHGKLAQYLTPGKTICVTTDFIRTKIYTDSEGKAQAGLNITIKTLNFVGNRSWSSVKKELPEDLIIAVEDAIEAK